MVAGRFGRIFPAVRHQWASLASSPQIWVDSPLASKRGFPVYPGLPLSRFTDPVVWVAPVCPPRFPTTCSACPVVALVDDTASITATNYPADHQNPLSFGMGAITNHDATSALFTEHATDGPGAEEQQLGHDVGQDGFADPADVTTAPQILLALWSTLAVAGVFIALKLLARSRKRLRWWWDDYILLLSWVRCSPSLQSRHVKRFRSRRLPAVSRSWVDMLDHLDQARSWPPS